MLIATAIAIRATTPTDVGEQQALAADWRPPDGASRRPIRSGGTRVLSSRIAAEDRRPDEDQADLERLASVEDVRDREDDEQEGDRPIGGAPRPIARTSRVWRRSRVGAPPRSGPAAPRRDTRHASSPKIAAA